MNNNNCGPRSAETCPKVSAPLQWMQLTDELRDGWGRVEQIVSAKPLATGNQQPPYGNNTLRVVIWRLHGGNWTIRYTWTGFSDESLRKHSSWVYVRTSRLVSHV